MNKVRDLSSKFTQVWVAAAMRLSCDWVVNAKTQ